jgi:putative ABC transport system substrate-binding protein
LLKEAQAAAQALGLQLQALEVGGPDEFDQAFAAMTREHADTLVVIPSGLFSSHSRWLAELAVRHRLPSMHEGRAYVDAGGLMSYGPSRADMYRRAVGPTAAGHADAAPPDYGT